MTALDNHPPKRLARPSLPLRICPECGQTFTATHGKAVFCCPDHQKRFHHVMKMRGKVAMPFALVWRTGKRGRTDDTAYAQGELSALMDRWNAEDKACGRRPDLIVMAKRREMWRAGDEEGGSRANCFIPAPNQGVDS